MEQETNIWHLVMEHSIVLFTIGAVIIAGLVLVTGVAIGRRSERKNKKNQ